MSSFLRGVPLYTEVSSFLRGVPLYTEVSSWRCSTVLSVTLVVTGLISPSCYKYHIDEVLSAIFEELVPGILLDCVPFKKREFKAEQGRDV